MSKNEVTPSIKSLQKENQVLKANLQVAMDSLYGLSNRKPSLVIKKEYDRNAQTITLYASFRVFRKGSHTWTILISKGNMLSRPVSKTFVSNENNMGYEDIRIATIGLDGAYQYPFKIYTYELKCGLLEDYLELPVPDKSKAPLNG